MTLLMMHLLANQIQAFSCAVGRTPRLIAEMVATDFFFCVCVKSANTDVIHDLPYDLTIWLH